LAEPSTEKHCETAQAQCRREEHGPRDGHKLHLKSAVLVIAPEKLQ
jgi:hypothetical protein